MSVYETGLTVLWRGSLASCNYGCGYCPFAKTTDSRDTLADDQRALERFESWAESRPYRVSILVTPWGEALIRKYYRNVMARLSWAENIDCTAIQTNLSCSIDWLAECNLAHIAFWTTYHPGETPRETFLGKVWRLEEMGARYSVGIVGLKDHISEIEALKKDLPDKAYLWVNAYKRIPNYYSGDDLERLVTIDPLFAINNRTYETQGRMCHAGESVVSVLFDGTARRCHFLEQPLGNIYDSNFEKTLAPRACTAKQCRCHIGYSHLKDLDLRRLFGDGFLERRPQAVPDARTANAHIAHYIDAGGMRSTARWQRRS